MAEVYLPSNQIEVFPSVLRDKGHQVESRFMHWEDLSRFYGYLPQGDSFVITSKEEANTSQAIEFFINGIYVCIKDIQSLASIIPPRFESNTLILAQIPESDEFGVVGRDEQGKYTGVIFRAIGGVTPRPMKHSLVIGKAKVDNSVVEFIETYNQVVIDGGDK